MIDHRISTFLLDISGKIDSNKYNEIEISLKTEIRDAIASIIENAVSEVSALGVEEAMENIRISELGGYPQIASDTGSFNFSQDAYQMLPSLLKNPKISKDGHKYKTIPIGKSGNKPLKRKDVDSGISNMYSVSPMGDIVSSMVSAFISGATTISVVEERQQSGRIEFRTASEKQDAHSQWVYPGKKANIDFEVMAINSNMISKIDELVQSIIDKKREEI